MHKIRRKITKKKGDTQLFSNFSYDFMKMRIIFFVMSTIFTTFVRVSMSEE